MSVQYRGLPDHPACGAGNGMALAVPQRVGDQVNGFSIHLRQPLPLHKLNHNDCLMAHPTPPLEHLGTRRELEVPFGKSCYH